MSNQTILEKKSEIIIAQYSKTLTVQNIKLFNYVLYLYQKNKSEKLVINVMEVVELGFIVDGSTEDQTEALWSLLNIGIQIDYLNANDKHYDTKQKELITKHTKLMNIFESLDIIVTENSSTGRRAKHLEVVFTKSFLQLLNSNLYHTKLDLESLHSLNKNGIKLFEILSSLAPNQAWHHNNYYTRVVTIPIEKLKTLFGIDKKSIYNENHRFTSNFLKLTTENIVKNVDHNNLTLSKIGKSKRYFETIKNGISVSDIAFTVNLPKQELKGAKKEYSEQEKLFFEERKANKEKLEVELKLKNIKKRKEEIAKIK